MGGGKITRYCIDTSDSNTTLYLSFYNWCDVYGKVNFNKANHGAYKKIVPIAPNFAIKLWEKPKALYLSFINYIKSRERIPFSFRNFWRIYAATLLRDGGYFNPPIIDDDILSENKKIFFMSRWWKGQDECNKHRTNFIHSCHSIKHIAFEGGLIPDDGRCAKDVEFLAQRKYSYQEYIKKTAESLVVFNTPAYHLCHGWKLPEFLWLGKAIISTPFVNELPIPMIHGKNIWFVNNEQDIHDALTSLLNNPALRKKLENGAKEYWQNHCQPAQALKRFIYQASNS